MAALEGEEGGVGAQPTRVVSAGDGPLLIAPYPSPRSLVGVLDLQGGQYMSSGIVRICRTSRFEVLTGHKPQGW